MQWLTCASLKARKLSGEKAMDELSFPSSEDLDFLSDEQDGDGFQLGTWEQEE